MDLVVQPVPEGLGSVVDVSIGNDPTFAERQARRRDKKKEEDEREIEQPYMREREGKSKDPKSNNEPFEGAAYDRQGRPKNERDIEGGNMVDR